MNKVILHESFVGKGCEGKISARPCGDGGGWRSWIDLVPGSYDRRRPLRARR